MADAADGAARGGPVTTSSASGSQPPDQPPDQIERVLALVREAERDDGFSALNEAASLRLRHDPSVRTFIHVDSHAESEHDSEDDVEDDSGAVVVAYGQLAGDPGQVAEAALVVHPHARRQGLGTDLLTEMLAVSEHGLEIWAPHATPAAGALAARTGLVAVRSLLTMHRPLDGAIASAPAPPGLELRAFRPGHDEEAWLAVNARAFADHPEQGGLTRVDLDQRMSETWFDPSGFLLATRSDGTVVGFHWTKQHPNGVGEVYVLGVDPDAGVRGLGRPLLVAGLRHLHAAGNTEVLLYADETNTRAVTLYERAGFTVASRDILYASPMAASTMHTSTSSTRTISSTAAADSSQKSRRLPAD